MAAWIDRLFGRRAPSVAQATSAADHAADILQHESEAAFRAGIEELRAGNCQRAVRCFERALSGVHDHADAHYHLGIAHMRLGELDDAMDALVMALHFFPDLHAARHAIALIERSRGRTAEALAQIELAVEGDDRSTEYLNLRGALLVDKGDVEAAIECFERILTLDPQHSIAHSNLGYLLFRDRGEYERGAALIREALRLDPDNQVARCNHTMVLNHEGRMDESIAECDRLLAADPLLHEARLNRGLASLMLGCFHTGWDDYEARKHVRSNFVPRPSEVPEWQGQDLAGKTLLICAEQGIGDEIMFASCFGDIAQRADRCIIECSARLRALFERSFRFARLIDTPSGDRYVAAPDAQDRADYRIFAGSLPRYCRRESNAFPRHEGYLACEPSMRRQWRERLDALGSGMKIGVSWRGGMASTRRILRSIDLAHFAPLLSLPGTHFVDLQYGDTAQERSRFESDHRVSLHHWQEAIDDFDQCAALIANLDLVISVCTAAVHLTGALGRPAWVLVPKHPEWRYMQAGTVMPWYPSARLFRQNDTDSWEPVIRAVAAELASYRPRFAP